MRPHLADILDGRMLQLAAAELNKSTGLFWHVTLDMGRKPELHFTFEGRESQDLGIDGNPISPVIVREEFKITQLEEFGANLSEVQERIAKIVDTHRNALEQRAFSGPSLWRRLFGGKP